MRIFNPFSIFKFPLRKLLRVIQLSKQAFRGYKKELIALALLGILSTLLEAIGVNALIPLFSFFTEDERGATDFISTQIINLFTFLNIEFSLVPLLIFIVFLFLLKAVASIFLNYLKVSIRTIYEQQTMDKLFRNTLSANWSYLLGQKLGHLETVLVIDTHKTANLLFALSNLITMLGSFFVYLIVAMNISETVTFFTIGIGIFILLSFMPILRRVRHVSREVSVLNKDIARFINESIAGLKALKIMSVEREASNIASNLFTRLRSLRIKSGVLEQISSAFIEPIGIALIALIVLFSYYQTSYNLGALAAIIYLVQKMFVNIQGIQSKLHGISGAIPFVESVLSYEKQADSFREKISREDSKFVFEQSIAFKEVDFQHADRDMSLANITFTVPKGSMVGIIGPSGAGKTTLLDLLLRFFEPDKGIICIDDIDIQSINLYELRKNIAYVSQEVFIINGSIAENITFYDSSITESDLLDAVKRSDLEGLVDSLPKGINTMVGERGVSLSVGQRQRIAIARALVRGTKILLLDEATSALDRESEIDIHKTIQGLRTSVTIFVVAHQFSLVRDSDLLFVLKNGKMVEQGTPRELLANRESYTCKIQSLQESSQDKV